MVVNFTLEQIRQNLPWSTFAVLQYIAREPEVDVVHTSNKDDATIEVAGVIYQETDPEMGEIPDLEGYHQKEGV